MCQQPGKAFILDRFEEGTAVLISDDGELIHAPGLEGREGDAFTLEEDGEWLLRPDIRAEREARIKSKMNRLFGKKE